MVMLFILYLIRAPLENTFAVSSAGAQTSKPALLRAGGWTSWVLQVLFQLKLSYDLTYTKLDGGNKKIK